MIDIENPVFTKVATAVRSAVAGVTIEGVENYSPSKFPYVSFVEADNYFYSPTRDSASNENHDVLMYEVNIFSNKQGGKKAQAKSIEAVIDEVMNEIGFTKSSSTPMTSKDGTIYRRVARYTAIVSKDKVIYRR